MRIDRAVGLVFYESHEGRQGSAGFVLRGRRRGRIAGCEGAGADGGTGLTGYAGGGRHGERGRV